MLQGAAGGRSDADPSADEDATRLERLRADLYRPGADEDAVRRYRSAAPVDDRMPPPAEPAPSPTDPAGTPSRPSRGSGIGRAVRRWWPPALLALAAGAVVVTGLVSGPPPGEPLARGALTGPLGPRWSADQARAGDERVALSLALHSGKEFGQLLRTHPGLLPGIPVTAPVRAADGHDRVLLDIAGFARVATRSSVLVVVVRCSSRGALQLELSTVSYARSQLLLRPLRTVRSDCGAGPQIFRYRPIPGRVPAAAVLVARGRAGVAVALIP